MSKKKAEVTRSSVNIDEDGYTGDLDAPLFYESSTSRKGSTKKDAIPVEQYNEDRRPFNIHLNGSRTSRRGSTKNDAISVEQYSENRDLIGILLNESRRRGSTKDAISVEQHNEDRSPFDILLNWPSRRGSRKKDAISVEQYNEDRDDLAAYVKEFAYLHTCHQYIDDDELIFNLKPRDRPSGKRTRNKRLIFSDSVTEKGEPSNSSKDPDFVCEICAEYRAAAELFSIKECPHFYCRRCMVQYVASKLQDNIQNISCPVPDCTKGFLDPEHCRPILPQDVFDRWCNALCEAVVLDSQKFYCPFKDCSAMLIDDGGEVITQSECPNCRRLFCAQCKVAWHSEIGCDEFQKLNPDERKKEDIMFMNFATDRKWKRCPSCRIYVERTSGCNYMKCRCGTSFCYQCGDSKPMSERWHYCSSCKR